MKKFRLTSLALIGINIGLICNGCGANAKEEQMSPEMRSFYEMLDPNAQKKFLELDTEHKRAAMSIMDQYCKAMQECKGLREKAVEEQYADQMHQ